MSSEQDRIPVRFLQQRIATAESKIGALSADALLVLADAQKGYLSGVTTGVHIAPGGAVLITEGPEANFYVTSGTDFEQCKIETAPAGFEVKGYFRDQDQSMVGETARLAAELGLRSVAVEARHVSMEEFNRLQHAFQQVGVQLVTVTGVIDPLREVKDAWEIEQIRRANEVNRIAFEHVVQQVKPGVTEWQLAAELESQMLANGHGSSRVGFQSIVVSGPRSCLPHGSPSRRALEKGDFVTIDFGATWNGYTADTTRTFVVGKASDRQRAVYSAALDGQLAAIELMKPDVRRRDAPETAAALITERGFGGHMSHGAGGHGIGLEVHEGPSTGDEGVWVPGNVMTIEPGIYFRDWGGVRIEDNIVITAGGAENITFIGKELLEL
ncbi:MAG: Xaa-Pro peptidase family protein [Thermaerobacterales bacterium]